MLYRKEKTIDIIGKKDYSGVVTENNNSHERRIIMKQTINTHNNLIEEKEVGLSLWMAKDNLYFGLIISKYLDPFA